MQLFLHQRDESIGQEMSTTKRIMNDTKTLESELKQLQDQLSEAWWYEEPLSKIQRIENEIQRRLRALGQEMAAAK